MTNDSQNNNETELLTEVRGILRITVDDTVINTEITNLIKACQKDLIKNGITSNKANDTKDSLIKMAIFCYCKAEFGLDNKNYDKFRSSYETLRNELALTDAYINESEESKDVE
jgi:hypothetical protein